MQYLALSRRCPGVTAQHLKPWLREEAQAAWALHASGVLRSVHMCPDRPGSMLVLECADLEEVHSHLATLPMVAQGLIDFDVSRMLPYTGFDALFKVSKPSKGQS
jgi:hypothetical protein